MRTLFASQGDYAICHPNQEDFVPARSNMEQCAGTDNRHSSHKAVVDQGKISLCVKTPFDEAAL